MALADFLEGYFHTLRWSASHKAIGSLRREVTRQEIADSGLVEAVSTFYTNHRLGIEAARGIEGINQSTAWQAGHDLCFVHNGRRGFRAVDWGVILANRLTEDANVFGKREIEYRDGVINIVRT